MKRLLLDTHMLLWWMQGSSKLSARSRQLVADPANLIFVSSASICEIRIKQGLGKLDLPVNFGGMLVRLGFEELTVSVAPRSFRPHFDLSGEGGEVDAIVG